MAISKISATELATVADANTLVSTYSATNTSWGWQGVTTFMVQEIQG